MSVIDLTGQTFGRLTVIERAGSRNQSALWRCRCECGGEKLTITHSLRSGITKSCGCIVVEMMATKQTIHGLSGRPEFRTWTGMITRCTNPREKSWPDYGGRGIKVCDRWLNDFAAFYADMGPKPSPGHSIERDDTDGDYEPNNCRWATKVEQMRNTRRNRHLTLNGETKTLTEWASIVGIDRRTIAFRLKAGWSDERALTEPVGFAQRRDVA